MQLENFEHPRTNSMYKHVSFHEEMISNLQKKIQEMIHFSNNCQSILEWLDCHSYHTPKQQTNKHKKHQFNEKAEIYNLLVQFFNHSF